MKNRVSLTLGLACATLMAFAAQGGQEQLAASIKQTRVEAKATSDQLSSTLAALNALSKQKKGDLTPAYQAFRAEVPRTQNAATVTAQRADSMEKQRGQYFANWQS